MVELKSTWCSLSHIRGVLDTECKDRRQRRSKYGSKDQNRGNYMSRRHSAEKRLVLPDAKFGDVVLTKFVNI